MKNIILKEQSNYFCNTNDPSDEDFIDYDMDDDDYSKYSSFGGDYGEADDNEGFLEWGN